MVGRAFSADGKDLGDTKFFERDMGITPKTEAETLQRLDHGLVEYALHQAEELAARNPEIKIILFAELAKLYPEDPRAKDWEDIGA